MAPVTRFLTFVDLDDSNDEGSRGPSISVSALHQAVLADGRRLVVFDDRGWSETTIVARRDPAERERRLAEIVARESWAYQEMERTARVVVGPDEPPDGHSYDEIEELHWEYVASILRRQGVPVDVAELKGLPHDVELSDRVLARIGHAADGSQGGAELH